MRNAKHRQTERDAEMHVSATKTAKLPPSKQARGVAGQRRAAGRGASRRGAAAGARMAWGLNVERGGEGPT